MRRRVQGGGCPLRRALEGRDPTPREPWSARPREKARGRESPVSRAAASNLTIRRRPRSERRPLWKEPRLRSGGRTNRHPDLSTTASGAGGKTGFAASTSGFAPPLPRRERAALLAARDGGAQARRPSEPATGARPGPEPATTAGPRSPGRDRRPRGAALAWANRPGRSPADRPRSPAPRRFRVASKRCSNS